MDQISLAQSTFILKNQSFMTRKINFTESYVDQNQTIQTQSVSLHAEL